MKNKEYLVKMILEKKFLDKEAIERYIACPYYALYGCGDCNEFDGIPPTEMCIECKLKWLESERLNEWQNNEYGNFEGFTLKEGMLYGYTEYGVPMVITSVYFDKEYTWLKLFTKNPNWDYLWWDLEDIPGDKNFSDSQVDIIMGRYDVHDEEDDYNDDEDDDN